MKKITIAIAIGVLAAYATTSENTVTLKRDILGRSLGDVQKKPVLVKNTKINKEKTLAKASNNTTTSTSAVPISIAPGFYSSMANLYNPNATEPNLSRTATATYINDKSTNYQDKFDFNGHSNISLNEFKNKAQNFEDYYTNFIGNYSTPLILLPYNYMHPYDATQYTYSFGAYMPDIQSDYYSDHGDYFMTRNGAFSVTGIRNSAHDKGYIGAGQNMFFMSEGAPFPAYVNYVQKASCHQSQYRGFNKAEELTYNVTVANEVAIFAGLFVYDAACANSDRFYTRLPDNPRTENLSVGVHDYSVIGFNTQSNASPNLVYGEEAAILDDFIYQNRTIDFASMANRNNFALANNAISVAAYNHHDRIMTKHDDVNPKFNNGKNYIKPEISAMTKLYLNSHRKITKHASNGVNYTGDAKTSYASVAPTLAAAMITDLISVNPFYKWHPEVVKALLLTTGEDLIQANRYTKNNYLDGKVEVGMRSPNFTSMIKGNRSRYWIGNNNSFFNNNKIEFVEKNLVKGKKYRVAIAWLNSGKYQIANNEIQQDLDLSVTTTNENNRQSITSSMSYANSYEILEFENPTNNDVQITISRYKNHGGRVMIGYNIHEID